MTDVWGSRSPAKGPERSQQEGWFFAGNREATNAEFGDSWSLPPVFRLVLLGSCKSFVQIVLKSAYRSANHFQKWVTYCESFWKVRVVLRIVFKSPCRTANRSQKCVSSCKSFSKVRNGVRIVSKLQIVSANRLKSAWRYDIAVLTTVAYSLDVKEYFEYPYHVFKMISRAHTAV